MNHYWLTVSMLFLVLSTLAPVQAALQKDVITYRDGDTLLEGYMVHDTAIAGERPGVLVIHDWNGLDDYEKRRADMLAELGYVAFALDIYGQGVRPTNARESGAQAGKYRADRALLRRRAQAGLDVLRSSPLSDDRRLAAIGYCFGGGAALELARSGADLAGTVSFHGNLDTPRLDDAKNIKGSILVLHGADDPGVTADQVAAFREEMRRAKVDWQLIAYGNAVHAFTEPNAGDDPSKGAAYNEKADKRSWAAMRQFFDEIFGAS